MTNPDPAANVSTRAPDTNARGTSFSAALVQSVSSQTGAAETTPTSFRVPGNVSERASSAQVAGHAATAQTPPARLSSDAGLGAKAGAKARPAATAANSMAGGKLAASSAATTANPPTNTAAPEPGRSNIVVASAAQRAEPGASVDTSNPFPASLAATLTPFDEGAATPAMFSPAQGSIDTKSVISPTATSTGAVDASLTPPVPALSISPLTVGAPGRLSTTTATINPTATSPTKAGDAAISLVSQPDHNGTVSSSAGIGSTDNSLAGLSRASFAVTNPTLAGNTAEPALSSSDATGGMAGTVAFNGMLVGAEPMLATDSASSAAPADGNAASGGNELFRVMDDNGGNSLPHGKTAEGDALHLPLQPASPAAVLSPSDPALSTSAVVIPSSSGTAFETASKFTAPQETPASLRSPLASGTGEHAVAKASQAADTLTQNRAATVASTTRVDGMSSTVFDCGRAANAHETTYAASAATGESISTQTQAAGEFMAARGGEATSSESQSLVDNTSAPRSASTGSGLAASEKLVTQATADASTQELSNTSAPTSPSSPKTTATPQPAAAPAAIASTLASSSPAANASDAAAAGTPLPAAVPVAAASTPSVSVSSAPEQAPPAPPHQMLDSAPLDTGAQPGVTSGAHPASDSGPLQMQVGIHTSAFGNVEIRTVIERSQVGISIHGERDVARWFSSEVGGLETGLNNQHLNLTAVNFSNTRSSIQTATGFQQGQPGQHLPQGRNYGATSGGGSTPADEPANEPEISAAIPALGPDSRVSILA